VKSQREDNKFSVTMFFIHVKEIHAVSFKVELTMHVNTKLRRNERFQCL